MLPDHLLSLAPLASSLLAIRAGCTLEVDFRVAAFALGQVLHQSAKVAGMVSHDKRLTQIHIKPVTFFFPFRVLGAYCMNTRQPSKLHSNRSEARGFRASGIARTN